MPWRPGGVANRGSKFLDLISMKSPKEQALGKLRFTGIPYIDWFLGSNTLFSLPLPVPGILLYLPPAPSQRLFWCLGKGYPNFPRLAKRCPNCALAYTQLFFFNYAFIIWNAKKISDRDLATTGSLPSCLQQLGLDNANARIPELDQDLSCE